MVIGNSEQAKQELTLPKIGEVAQFEKAVNTPIIQDSPVEQLKQVLRLVMIKIGLRSQNWPTDEEKAVLIEHIYSNFGGNRIEEIKLAFDMAFAGKLDLSPEDTKCYENFSCAYFSTIMSSYRRWSAQEYRQLKPEEPPMQRIFTQEELDDAAREDVERQYRLFVKGFELKGVAINKAILEKDGLLREGESVIDFFKRKIEAVQPNIYVRNV
jgi:hypothetical protein